MLCHLVAGHSFGFVALFDPRSMFTKLAVIEEKTSKLQGGGSPKKRSPLTGLSPSPANDPLFSVRSSSGVRGGAMKGSLKTSDDGDRVVALQRALREKDSHIAQLQVRRQRVSPAHTARAAQ